MTRPSPVFDAGDIALHSGWMRRLAFDLLGDAGAADDVVQETWAKLGGGRRPGYLAAVVRSFARRRQRSEGRRARREQAAASAEALPSAAEVAERSEIARRLAESIEALPEPYRTTVVLRYYHELPAAEIARRAGIPAGTVRARLKRGLDTLRARLDERQGGRGRWVSALLPLGRPRAAAAGFSVATLFAMKLSLAVLCSLALLALVWRTIAVDPGEGRGPSEGASASAAPADSGGEERRRDVPEVRREVSPSESPAVAAASTIETSRGRVRASVVDELRNPIPDAWLRLRLAPAIQADADERGTLLLEMDAAELERVAAFSEARGVGIEIGAPRRRTRILKAVLEEGRSEIELGEIALAPGGAVSGRVIDESGRPVAGALVAFGVPLERTGGPDPALHGPADLDADRSAWKSVDPAIVGTSAADGTFRLAGLAPGHGTAWARTQTSLWAHSEPIGLHAGEEIRGIELVVHEAPETTISGRVVDPDGRALPGLMLRISSTDRDEGWWDVATDAQGAFHFASEKGTSQDIHADAPSWDWEDLAGGPFAPGTHGLVLAFERSAWLEVEARDPSGASVSNGRVVGVPAEGETKWPIPRCESPLDAQGRARLRRPATALCVRVEAPGYRDQLVGPLDPATFPRPLVVTLEPVPALLGRVLRRDGTPAAGAAVSLHRAAGTGSSVRPPGAAPVHGEKFVTHQGWAGSGDPFVYALFVEPEARVTADEAGRFRLPLPGVDAASSDSGGLGPGQLEVLGALGYVSGPARRAVSKPGGSWYVHAVLEGEATVTSGPHVFEPEQDATLDLRLPPGGSIAGRLVLAGEGSPTGWTARASDGLAQVAAAPVRADGTFELGDLHAGGWQVRLFEPTRRYWPGGNVLTERVPVPDVEVVAGTTVAYEHHTGVRMRARLLGHLSVDGAPPGPWRVSVRTATVRSAITSYEATLDPDGDFAIELEPDLRTSLYLVRNLDGAQLTVFTEPTILPGTNTWDFAFSTARLEGTLDATEAEGGFGGRPTYVVERDGVSIRVQWTVGEDGRFGPIPVCAGPGRLLGPRTDWREPAPVWDELDLEPGETRRLELPPRR